MQMSKQGGSGRPIRMSFLMLGSFIQVHLHAVQLLYCKHEQSKKREYCEQVHEAEQRVFTPLVFSPQVVWPVR